MGGAGLVPGVEVLDCAQEHSGERASFEDRTVVSSLRCWGRFSQVLAVVGSDPAPSHPLLSMEAHPELGRRAGPRAVSWGLFPGPALTSRTFSEGCAPLLSALQP